MRNDVVSIFDAVVGRMIAGVLNLSSSHPIAVCLMLAGLAGLVCTFWLELMGVSLQRPWAGRDGTARLRRSWMPARRDG